MICQVCKEDHRTLVNKEWCDRSQLEIENDYLKAETARLREALEYYADKAWINIKMPYLTEVDFDDVSKPFPDQKPMGGRRAREALKGGE
jgi:hypothetical protein